MRKSDIKQRLKDLDSNYMTLIDDVDKLRTLVINQNASLATSSVQQFDAISKALDKMDLDLTQAFNDIRTNYKSMDADIRDLHEMLEGFRRTEEGIETRLVDRTQSRLADLEARIASLESDKESYLKSLGPYRELYGL